MMIVAAKPAKTAARTAKLSIVLLLATAALSAQTSRIQARIGNGGGTTGKCTIEVEVDDAAEVEVSGAEARVRTLTGSAANLRRMDCTGPLPRNPADFRFSGVDGRGSQQLIRNPQQGGFAVVRIDDRDGGREGYTFDLTWSNNGSSANGNNGGFNNGNGGFGDNRGGNNNGRGNNGNWNNGANSANAGQAMRACQAEVANRIRKGGGYSDIQFVRAEYDDNRGRNNDRISGVARAIQSFGADQFEFTCRADLSNGRLGDVRVDRIKTGRR